MFIVRRARVLLLLWIGGKKTECAHCFFRWDFAGQMVMIHAAPIPSPVHTNGVEERYILRVTNGGEGRGALAAASLLIFKYRRPCVVVDSVAA